MKSCFKTGLKLFVGYFGPNVRVSPCHEQGWNLLRPPYSLHLSLLLHGWFFLSCCRWFCFMAIILGKLRKPALASNLHRQLALFCGNVCLHHKHESRPSSTFYFTANSLESSWCPFKRSFFSEAFSKLSENIPKEEETIETSQKHLLRYARLVYADSHLTLPKVYSARSLQCCCRRWKLSGLFAVVHRVFDL